MTEDTPPPYAGPIRVVYINESSWMGAGDMGTIRKTIAALGPVEASVEMSLNAISVEPLFVDEKTRHKTRHICTQWRQVAADIMRPVTDGNPERAPVVFVSTGQIGLRPAFSVLRDIVGRTNVWLDVCADMLSCFEDHPAFPVAPTMINAFVDERLWNRYGTVESTGHEKVFLPYLPELRGLPSRSEARARLAERYHLEFKRPLMAVLIGQNFDDAERAIEAARALSADLLVTTSPRSIGGEAYKGNGPWKDARIFHVFGKSPEPNPYADFIAAADIFAVDADSMSMPADVLAQGKPVALFGGVGNQLVMRGLATTLTGAGTEWHQPSPHKTPGTILHQVVRTELAKLAGGGP